ncbi:MAG TPA: carboxypeptidase-like regulatory domain-containing protein [Thermoanaerobaculia bacterium]
MRRLCVLAFASAILATAGTARPDALPTFLNVLGSVTNAARPVGNALVIALNLNSLEASQTFSRADGSFALSLLPAAVYRIIAVKQGFSPATTTVVPVRQDNRVSLRLESDKRSKKDVNQEMWEIRGSLPPDILRELDDVMTPPIALVSTSYEIPRLKGEMTSMTSVAADTTNPGFAQSSLGVQSRITDNWQIGFRGNIHRIEDPADDSRFGSPIAESSGMQMELRSSQTDTYRVGSTKSWWRYRDDDQQQADVRSHNLEWEHGDAHVQVRYLAQQNLFIGNPGSDLIEIAGNTTVMQTRHSDLGVAVRVTQESLHNTANATFRTADLTANASLEIVPSFSVRYGMSSRLGLYGTEWAPRTGAEWKLSKDTSFVVSGLFKVYDQERPNMMPSIVAWSDDSRVLPRYAYSVGLVSGDGSRDHFSATFTVSAADSPQRLIFTDGSEQFWDGMYVDSGDVRRDLRVAYRKELWHRLLIDVGSTAGVARPRGVVIGGEKVYVAGDLASTFHPTGTTLAVSYRQLHQPQQTLVPAEYRTERMNVHLAQALHLPLDLKLLLGFEVARATNSTLLFETLDADGVTRKYIGGLAVNF